MIDMTKTYETRRDKFPVRPLCDDAEGAYPVIGLVNNTEPQSWTSEGKFTIQLGEHAMDLVEVVEPVTVWLNIYKDGGGHWWPSKDEAVKNAARGCIARVCVTFRPGDVLEDDHA